MNNYACVLYNYNVARVRGLLYIVIVLNSIEF